MPVTTYSDRARRMRATARSRVGAQTLNFEINGSVQSPAVTGQYLDMIQVPYWDGNPAHPYPSVTAMIDFRGKDIGEFVFHCHILNHEDLGMMNIIQVKLPTDASNTNGASHAVASNVRPAAHGSLAAAAEATPDALEIADRVVQPSGNGVAQQPAISHHH